MERRREREPQAESRGGAGGSAGVSGGGARAGQGRERGGAGAGRGQGGDGARAGQGRAGAGQGPGKYLAPSQGKLFPKSIWRTWEWLVPVRDKCEESQPVGESRKLRIWDSCECVR